MSETTLIAVGDIILDLENHSTAFDHVKEVMQAGDITVASCDQIYSDKGESPNGFWQIRVGAPPHSAAMLDTLVDAGVNVINFANNHSLDWGYEAAFDCLALCKDVGVAAVGIGRNIKAARQPVIVERNGTTFGFLAYCSIGPAGYEATAERPGHAPMRAHTHYEQWDPQPGTPPLIHTFAHKEDLREMVDDISRLRKQVDVVIVGFHWGVHYITELIADYEYEVGHAAIDAGADLILGNHPHLPKGIEVYKGKVIFHAMNDLATHGGWRPPATQPGCDYPDSQVWDWTHYGKLPEERFGNEHMGVGLSSRSMTEVVRTSMMAKITVENGSVSRVAYIPCYINDALSPEIVTREQERGQKVFEYWKKTSGSQGLNTDFEWDGDEIVVL